MIRPAVWISVEFMPPRDYRSCFDTAFETRSALRRAGYAAHLFSVNDRLDFLRPLGKDVVFPIAETCGSCPNELFGLRRALEALNVAKVGSTHEVVAHASDKLRARRTMVEAGFEVPAGVALTRGDDVSGVAEAFLRDHGLPAVIKPSLGRGGSLGVEFVADELALRWHVQDFCTSQEPPLVLETYVRGVEVTVWVLEHNDIFEVGIAEIEKIEQPIFDRVSKVGSERRGLLPPRRKGRIHVHRPARLPGETLRRIEATAIASHRLFGASSYSRTDMVVRDSMPVVLEINTTPRLRAHSELGPVEPSEAAFEELVAGLVDDAAVRDAREPAVVAQAS
jgi:D-alanine-D-alanine ligase